MNRSIMDEDSEEKKLKYDNDEDDSDNEDENDDKGSEDSDYEIHKVGKKKNLFKKKSVKRGKVKAEGKSAYEKMIEENKAKKMEFLESLKIDELKAGFSKGMKRVKKSMNKASQPVKKVIKRREPLPPLRKSRRLANVDFDFSEESFYLRAVKEAKKLEKAARQAQEKYKLAHSIRRKSKKKISYPPKRRLAAEMTFEDTIWSKKGYQTYMKDICIEKLKYTIYTEYASYDRSVLNDLTLKKSNIVKLTHGRITAITWYPSKEYFIVAAGSKHGSIGIWNVNSDLHYGHMFSAHNEETTHVQFNPYNSVQMFSSSHEGTLRCGDLTKNMFYEVYNVSKESSCQYFDFLSATTYLVAQSDGQIVFVDKRSNQNSEKKHTCHDYSIETVNIHPVNKNVFVSADSKGLVRLWDLRKLQEDPVADITHHQQAVNSAFFSPVSGNSILTTSLDNSVCIFDSTNLTGDIKLAQQMTHENNTRQWLSVFRATWAPHSDEIFVIGSLAHPRKIEIFDKELNSYCSLVHENLNNITFCNAFHPYIPLLAGANSSGKVFVFT